MQYEQAKDKEISQQHPKLVAETVFNSPKHPEYGADKAVALTFAQQKGALIAVMDGVGSGYELSALAAQTVEGLLNQITEKRVERLPSEKMAREILAQIITEAGVTIRQLQQENQNDQIDTTIAVAIITKENKLVTAHAGDSRIYKYDPRNNQLTQLTKDHAPSKKPPQLGQEPDPLSSLIYNSVGNVRESQNITFNTYEYDPECIYFAASDGMTDNLTGQGFPIAVRDVWNQCQGNINQFVINLAQRALNIMNRPNTPHAKPDDISISAFISNPTTA